MTEERTMFRTLIRRKLFWLVFAYVFLLVWSGIHRYNTPPAPPPLDRKTALVDQVVDAHPIKDTARIAYKEYTPDDAKGMLPVILVHGSPGEAGTFDALAAEMPGRRIISVDLPGFGASEMNIRDYSILAHSVYLEQLLEKLEIEKAHLVGFSLGGGVILHLANRSPELAASISFVSSIGVQEYEMFGNYEVNHAVHAGQLALVWAFRELTPHFGVFDGVPMSYARNFYDTDQTPLRGILGKIEQPFLIVHGKNDPLVPVEAAEEHARIVPQSEYKELEDDHFFVFLRPDKVAPLLTDFWKRVESGEARSRENADQIRLAMAAQPFTPRIVQAAGPAALCLFILLFFLATLNEDAAFVVAGVFAAQGRFGIAFAIIACLAGAVFSVLLFRSLGRRSRGGVMSGLMRRIFGEANYDAAKDSVEGSPAKAFLTRRAFGFRSPFYFAAGEARIGWFRSVPAAVAASAAWGSVIFLFAGFVTYVSVASTLLANTNTTYLLGVSFGLYLLSSVFLFRRGS